MPISTLDAKVKALLQKSGNRCAFPGCGKLLTSQETNAEITSETTVLSNIAHIVARSIDGPRGHFALPLEKRDDENNLILLCSEHHKLIDSQPHLYTVDRLRGIKEDHEFRVQTTLQNSLINKNGNQIDKNGYRKEKIFSSLLDVIKVPIYIFQAKLLDDAIRNSLIDQIESFIQPDIYLSFIVKDGILITFYDLTELKNPFHQIIEPHSIRKIPSKEFWENPVKLLWFIELLNNSIKGFIEHKGLVFDPYHKRFFFVPDSLGQVKDIQYRPLNQGLATKHVVWRPITKKTSLPKAYWLHRSINIRFYFVSNGHLCLSIRPEFRVTKDGNIPIESEKTGAKVTRKKSRMFNYDLFGEINFWRSFLSNNEPRIIIKLGISSIIISTALLSGEIEWPGIPEKFSKSFSNVEYAEDLFTWAKLQDVLQSEDEGLNELDYEVDDDDD